MITSDHKKTSVLICTCGGQIPLDYSYLEKQIEKIDSVSSVVVHPLVCQDEGLTKIAEMVDTNEGCLVIAACTNQKIQPLIDQFLRTKKKDSSRVQYVNIREHSAWVHTDKKEATQKSVAMIRGAVARSVRSQHLHEETKEIPQHATVIGGGIAGIETAISLSNLGYKVTILEASDTIGGHVRKLPFVAPTGKSGAEILSSRLSHLEKDRNITVLTESRVHFVEGEMGAFTIHYDRPDAEDEIRLQTSAVVLATGFREFKPYDMDEYRYGKNPDVITQFELSQILLEGDVKRPSDGGAINDVVMVQCVGSRSEDHKKDCSKLCCTFAIDNSLELLKANPRVHVRIVYMDIRVPFEHEMVYKESREKGVDYIRGRISMVWEKDGKTMVRIYDSLLDKFIDVPSDLLVLSTAILPPEGVASLSETLGYSLGDEGHVKELYEKLRRTETRRRGVIAVGAVTRPQFVHECITDAHAGALMVHNELQSGTIRLLARGAVLDVEECVGCSLCAQHCPRGVPLMIEQSGGEDQEDEDEKIVFKAAIDILNCHGCGVCQSLCPSAATQLNFLSNEQMWSEIQETLHDAGSDYPITLCFHCEECAVSTIDIVGTRRMEYPASTRLMPVPCAGRISIIDILKAFENGASTVMIAACETNRCHYGGTGNEIAQVQVDVARDILEAIGWKGDRVEMFRMFSAEPERFTRAVKEMVRRANEYGPTPVHTGAAGKWMEANK